MLEYDDSRLNYGGHDYIELEAPQRIEHLSEFEIGDMVVIGRWGNDQPCGQNLISDNEASELPTN
jgi:hypothetical protein